MKTTAFILTLFLAQPALAQPQVTVEKSADGLIRVVADDQATAPVEVVFETLTDYDHLARFIPDMHSSRIVSAAGEPLRVAQEGETGFLAYRFPLNVTFEIAFEPLFRVNFRSIAGNMREMEGFYQLKTMGETTYLHYEARFLPDFWVPPIIGPAIMQNEITRQFEGLAAEIGRRGKAYNQPGTPTVK